MTISAETRAEIVRQKELYPHPKSAVLPALWALQHEAGFLPAEGMRDVAEILGLVASEVQAVATFYSMYFQKPTGAHHALVCINVSCALRGSDEIVQHMEQRLGCRSGETTADGAFTWESTVECLGACGGAPAMQIDHHFHEDLTPDRVDAALDHYRGATGHAKATASATPAPIATTDSGAVPLPDQAATGSGDVVDGDGMPATSRKRASKRPRPNADDL